MALETTKFNKASYNEDYLTLVNDTNCMCLFSCFSEKKYYIHKSQINSIEQGKKLKSFRFFMAFLFIYSPVFMGTITAYLFGTILQSIGYVLLIYVVYRYFTDNVHIYTSSKVYIATRDFEKSNGFQQLLNWYKDTADSENSIRRMGEVQLTTV